MSIIDRILGRKPVEGPQIHAPARPAIASPASIPATPVVTTPGGPAR